MTLRSWMGLSLAAALVLGGPSRDAWAKKKDSGDEAAAMEDLPEIDEIQATYSAIQNIASLGAGGGAVASSAASSGSTRASSSGGSSSSSSGIAELSKLMDQSEILFEDAETEDAALLLDKVQNELPMQTAVVPTDLLLRLYRLQAVVWIAAGDDNKANRAVARAVAAAPGEDPPSSYGPELKMRHEDHARSMGGRLASIKIKGSGRAWIDGRQVTEEGLDVIVGDHFVQTEIAGGIESKMTYVGSNTRLATEAPAGSGPVADSDPLEEDLEEEELALDELDNPKPAREKKPAKSGSGGGGGGGIRVGWLVTGGVGVAAGGGLLALSYVNEQTFLRSDYTGSFDSCDTDEDCWAQARTDQIYHDANFVRATYMAGYGLLGVGIVATGVSFLASPTVAGDGLGLTVTGRW